MNNLSSEMSSVQARLKDVTAELINKSKEITSMYDGKFPYLYIYLLDFIFYIYLFFYTS